MELRQCHVNEEEHSAMSGQAKKNQSQKAKKKKKKVPPGKN